MLFGKVNPSGKLPISWPSDAPAVGGDFDGTAPSPLGDQPKFFDQLPGTGSGPGNAYNPLYPFGFGLSYTTFARSDAVGAEHVSARAVTARFTVTNTGSRDGTDIVPVYVNQPVSGVVTPPQRLVGFTRVTAEGGRVEDGQDHVRPVGVGCQRRRHRRRRPASGATGFLRRAAQQEHHDSVRRRGLATPSRSTRARQDACSPGRGARTGRRGLPRWPHGKPTGLCGRSRRPGP